MEQSTESPSPVALACGGDDNYAMALAVAIFSALVNMREGTEVHVFLLDGGISTVNARRIERVLQVPGIKVALHRIAPDMQQFEGMKIGRVNETQYLRLLLPDVLPEDLDRVLYIDADVIVETDVTTLWQQPMESYALLAVQDLTGPQVSSPGTGLTEVHKSLGLDPTTPYFNSGVMLLNLPILRAQRLGRAALTYARMHSDTIVWMDQDCLNAVVAGNWKQLDLRWNVQVSALRNPDAGIYRLLQGDTKAEIRELGRNAYILHFSWHIKPWTAGHIADFRFRPRFFSYLWRSRWFSRWEFVCWFVGWLRRALVHSFGVFIHRMVGGSQWLDLREL